jgi:hypothetical protein
MSTGAVRAFVVGLIALVLVQGAAGQVTRWINPAGGSFGDPTNWDNGVPDSAKEGRFELAGVYTVTIDQARTIRLLTSTAGDVTLDLAGVITTSHLEVTGGSMTLRNGEFKRTINLRQNAAMTIEQGTVIRIYGDGFPNGFRMYDTSTLLLRGDIVDPQTRVGCGGYGFFAAEPDCYVRIEGGRISASYFNNEAYFDMVNGSVCHSGGSFPRGVLANNSGAGGDNPTFVSGPAHFFNGGGIGGESGNYLGPGAILFEGQGTRAYGVSQIAGDVILRGGASIPPIGSGFPGDLLVRAGASLSVEADSIAMKRIAYPGSVRLAANSQIYQLQLGAGGSLTLELDGARSPHHSLREVSIYSRTFAGNLVLTATNPNALRLGDEIPLLKTEYGLFDGSFGQVTLPQLDGGRQVLLVVENTDPQNTRLIARIVPGGTNPCWSADFNGDGDYGTDQDIEAFFECLAGQCCALCGSADFNSDGDFGTGADIDAFFRVLSGHPC